MTDLIIFGASGHARVVADMVKLSPQWNLAGFIDGALRVGIEFAGSRVLGPDESLPDIVRGSAIRSGVIAVGDNFLRRKIQEKILAICPDFVFATVIHPSASIAGDVYLGPGTVVMAGSVVNPGARIGQSCIVNTNASLDHDSTMGDYASVAPGVVTGGNVRIGAGAAVGIGAVVKHEVAIGEDAVVGAGSIVMSDVAARSVSYGQPCRWVRDRTPGDRYL